MCNVSRYYKSSGVDIIGQLIRDVIGLLSVDPGCNWLRRLTVMGTFRSIYRSKVRTCIVEYVGQYCESKSVCCLSVDVVAESFVRCGKL